MYTSLSSCIIITFFWTSHWKSNATCVSVRHMYPSCFPTLISFLHPHYLQNPWPNLWHRPRLQELISVLLLLREDKTLVPQCSTAFQQWSHILFASVLVRYVSLDIWSVVHLGTGSCLFYRSFLLSLPFRTFWTCGLFFTAAGKAMLERWWFRPISRLKYLSFEAPSVYLWY